MSSKLDITQHIKAFEKIYAQIKTKYVDEGIKREIELEARREELARAVAFD